MDGDIGRGRILEPVRAPTHSGDADRAQQDGANRRRPERHEEGRRSFRRRHCAGMAMSWRALNPDVVPCLRPISRDGEALQTVKRSSVHAPLVTEQLDRIVIRREGPEHVRRLYFERPVSGSKPKRGNHGEGGSAAWALGMSDTSTL